MANTFELRVELDRMPEVLAKWDESAGKVMARLAFLTEGFAKANVQANGTIDTGAMLNGIYTVSADGDTSGVGMAEVESRRGGGYVIGGGGELEGTTNPAASAAVACAASYAVYIEYGGWPFMTPAADTAEAQLVDVARSIFLSDIQ